MNYIYNGEPLKHLHITVGFYRKNKLIEDMSNNGIPTTITTFNNWSESDVIPILTNIDICNYAYLPYAYFTDIEGYKRKVNEYHTLPKEEWQPIYLDTILFIKDCLAKYGHRYTVQKVLNISDAMYKYMYTGNTEKLRYMSTRKFYGYVNKAGLNLANYIIDRNVPTATFQGLGRFYNIQDSSIIREDGSIVLTELSESDLDKLRIKELEEEVIRLRQENFMLQNTINSLINRR